MVLFHPVATKWFRLTIINAYRTCKQDHKRGVSTTHLQQWNIIKETNQENEKIRSKHICGLISFINGFNKSNREVILLLDINEYFSSSESGLTQLTQQSTNTEEVYNIARINMVFKGLNFTFVFPH